MDIYFLRHGQTTYNERRCYYGKLDPPLSARGRLDADEAADVIAEVPIDLMFTSGLQRTQETAEIICAKNQWEHLSLVTVPDLNERDFGQWEGLNADQVAAAFPENWRQFLAAPFATTPLQGETYSSFAERVTNGFYQITAHAAPASKILIIGHLGALRVIAKNCLSEQQSFWQIEFPSNKPICYQYWT